MSEGEREKKGETKKEREKKRERQRKRERKIEREGKRGERGNAFVFRNKYTRVLKLLRENFNYSFLITNISEKILVDI